MDKKRIYYYLFGLFFLLSWIFYGISWFNHYCFDCFIYYNYWFTLSIISFGISFIIFLNMFELNIKKGFWLKFYLVELKKDIDIDINIDQYLGFVVIAESIYLVKKLLKEKIKLDPQKVEDFDITELQIKNFLKAEIIIEDDYHA